MTSVEGVRTAEPSKWFRFSYYAVIAVIALVLLLGVFKATFGIDSESFESSADPVIFSVMICGLFLGTPFVGLLMILTIWRLIKYKRRRLFYSIMMVPMIVWLVWGINAMIQMPI